MGFMMLMMVIVILGSVLAIGLMGSAFARRQFPRASSASHDGLLAEQAERIELLEEELRRVRDQADFTERLLTERSRVVPGHEPAKDQSDS